MAEKAITQTWVTVRVETTKDVGTAVKINGNEVVFADPGQPPTEHRFPLQDNQKLDVTLESRKFNKSELTELALKREAEN